MTKFKGVVTRLELKDLDEDLANTACCRGGIHVEKKGDNPEKIEVTISPISDHYDRVLKNCFKVGWLKYQGWSQIFSPEE